MAQEERQRADANPGSLEHLKPPSIFNWEAVDEEWRALFREYIPAGMYSREVLDQRTRELCAVAALTVLNYQGQLKRHLLSALDRGATRQELVEVILQMSVYGGFPATSTALSTLKTVLDQVDQATAADREP